MRTVSIIGCGYTGLRLARRLLGLGCPVHGFGTRAASRADIAATGAQAALLDLDHDIEPLDLEGQLIFYLVPPAQSGGGDARLERFLGAVRGAPQRIVYMSTTGVYGDRQGMRVDEDTAPAPRTERARRRLAAETMLRSFAEEGAHSWCILRVPGIYGPGRLPLERLARREPAIEPREATPGNRIHVEDLVNACIAAGTAAQADRRIYNITDGSDDSLTAYLQRVARLSDLPQPPLIGRAAARAMLSVSSWSFLGESRRVDNRRMLEELGVTLAYRDLDEGIRASLAEQRPPG